jgi:hypothetical protein
MARIKIDKTFLSLAVGVFTALMVIYFTYELWFNPVEFTSKFAPPLAVVDYGTLVRARWISNRILPYGIVMLLAVFRKEYKVAGYLLLLRFGVDLMDASVLALSLMNNHPHGNDAVRVMLGAAFLAVLNLLSAIHLIRKSA